MKERSCSLWVIEVDTDRNARRGAGVFENLLSLVKPRTLGSALPRGIHLL